MPVTFFKTVPLRHEIVVALTVAFGVGVGLFFTVPCADILVAAAAEEDIAS